MQKTALRVSGAIFLAVSLLHFVRAFEGVAIYVGPTIIPLYASWIGGVISGLLAAWMFVASNK